MKCLRPILFLTSDAPALPLPYWQAVAVLTAHFGHVQATYLNKLGQTFSLLPGLTWRGKLPQASYAAAGAQFSIFKELDTDGVIDVGDTETMFYCQVWGPSEVLDGTGYCDSRWWYPARTPYAGRMLDPPSVIKDLLGLKPPGSKPSNKYGSWSLQAKGRMEHEIAHHRVGENGEWWNYPGSWFTEEQKIALRGSPFLWVR